MLSMENCQAMSNMPIRAYAAQWHGISTRQTTGSLIKLSNCIQPISMKKEAISSNRISNSSNVGSKGDRIKD